MTTMEPAAKKADWTMKSVAAEAKFCPKCGSENVSFVPEPEARMVGGEVACGSCNKNFLVREFIKSE